MDIKIRDISNHDNTNGTLDFDQLRADGYDGVIIKATEGGDYVDPYYESNAKAAAAAGLHVGFYHYFSFVTDVQAQINNFLSHIQAYHQDYRPALDVEQDERNNATYPFNHKDRVRQMLNAISNPMIYSNGDGFAHLDSSFGQYPAWIANPTVSQIPTVPEFNVIGWQNHWNPDLNVFSDDVYLVKPTVSAPVQTVVVPSGDPYIRSYQQKLNRLHIVDPALVEDGIFGPKTESAVRQLESIIGLSQDGAYGPLCEAAYQSIVSKPQLQQGTTGTVTRYIQFRVGTGIDGQWGPNTNAAVINWQGQHGLDADGIVGPNTWAAMIG